MSEPLKYFAYGSNLHPGRLLRRVPSAKVIGPAAVSGYRLVFNKRGADDSAKCNISATADDGQQVYGALFYMDARDKPALDRAEGAGYAVHRLRVDALGRVHEAFTYIARPQFLDDCLYPYDWYHALVLAGARYHALPPDYLAQINHCPVQPDRDPKRADKNHSLLGQLLLDKRAD